jgi:hypothetical protein
MKKFILIIIVYISLLIPNIRDCFTQSQFQLSIGDSTYNEDARSIKQTTDGGYIVVGQSEVIFGEMYIVKLNSSGQLQWSRTISGTNYAFSVVQTTDGGYVVAGDGQSFGYGAYFVKLTSDGTVQWTRVLAGEALPGPVWSIVQTTDGGYAAAISPFEGHSSTGMIIVKLDSMGMLQWCRSIGGLPYARCIIHTIDKGYIVAGATGAFGAGDFDMFVVKLDSNGYLQWAKSIGGTSEDLAYSIVQTADGGYAVAGETRSFGNGTMYIVKLENSGVLQWTKVVGEGFDKAYSIIQTTDGGYCAAGYTSDYGDVLIVKFNPDGSLLWSRRIGGIGEDYARSIIQTSDGGYAAAGYCHFGTSGAMFIVKLDNDGNTCGNSTSPPISVGTGGILGSPTPTVTTPSLSETTVFPTTGTQGSVTPICVIGIQPVSNEIPVSYKLYQNYPNPFNPKTKIKFALPPSPSGDGLGVSLTIYDILGREVALLVNEKLNVGTYEVEWDATSYATGVYYYTILTGSFLQTKKMVLLK